MASTILPQDFYVYIHRKATTGEVFYVGKGKGYRAFDKKRGKFWKRIVNKHGLKIEIVQDGLQEWAAFELEIDLISLYGRIDLGTGSLVNCTDGGEGLSGHKFSDEHRAKISLKNKGENNAMYGVKFSEEHLRKLKAARVGQKPTMLGKKHSQKTKDNYSINRSGEKHHMYGKHHKEETKQKISKSLTGTKASDETKKKLSEIRKGRVFGESTKEKLLTSQPHRREIICVDTGVIYRSINEAAKFTGLSQSKISNVVNGHRKKTGGLRFTFLS